MEIRKIVAVIPTFNEAENISSLTKEVLGQASGIEVLVVDDDSPDGTWRLVQDLALTDPRVHLLRRRTMRGRGLAGIAGFSKALEMGAQIVIEMDGDYSHHPREIPRFLKAIENWDVVVGSRFLEGGGDFRDTALRSAVTRLAASYIRLMLGVRISDPTSGYRCFRASVLKGIELETMRSKGPSVVEEVLWRCQRRGCSIGEIPIGFEPRRAGSSKLSMWKLLETAWFVASLRMGIAEGGR